MGLGIRHSPPLVQESSKNCQQTIGVVACIAWQFTFTCVTVNFCSVVAIVLHGCHGATFLCL